MKKKNNQDTKVVRPQLGICERFKRDMLLNWRLYLILIPGIVSLVLFKLFPVVNMVIAFQDFSAFKGITGSEWIGFENFRRMFSDSYMLTLISNTLIIAILSIVCVFPIPIVFALLLNEERSTAIKNGVQSLSFLPYFISSAVMVSILSTMLNPSTGVINVIVRYFGGESVNYMARPEWFRPLYILLQIWQTFGYNAIIYIAGITAINPELYEAAEVDGCQRWGKMWHVTLPGISTSIITMLIISIGQIFSVQTERIILMYNPSNAATADVIQSYVYRIAFDSFGFPDYSYGTAVNLIKSIIAFILVVIANKLADKFAETRVF